MDQNSQFNFQEKAIPFITFNSENNKFNLNEEAVKLISSLQSPIGVIGVVGMYRTGKSYLLNRMLLNRNQGFGVGSTINPCTKGLWIWGTPLQCLSSEGKPINTLIIDSEGLGALDEDTSHDSLLFSLILLICSCFIYNSVGSIDEQAIQNLSLIVDITKNIQIRNKDEQCYLKNEEVDSKEYSQFFPEFYWLIRDFTLQLVNSDGDEITSNEYLECSLKEQKGFTDEIEEKNRIRKLLKNFFPYRHCITMVRPLVDESNLQKLDKIDISKLRPEFYSQIIFLRQKILQHVCPKQLFGQKLNGTQYVSMVQQYINAINKGEIPCIESTWNYICKNECIQQYNLAIDYIDQFFGKFINEKLPCSIQDQIAFYKSTKISIIEIYEKKTMGDMKRQYLDEILLYLKEKRQLLNEKNDIASNQYLEQFIQNEFVSIQKKLQSNAYKNFIEYEKDLILFQRFLQQHSPNLQNNERIINNFLFDQISKGTYQFIGKQQQEIDLAYYQLKTQEKKFLQNKQELEAQLESENDNKTRLQFEMEEIHLKMQSQIDSFETQIQQQVKLREKQGIQSQEEIEQLKQRCDKLQLTKEKLEIDYQMKEREIQNIKKIHQTEIDKMQELNNLKISQLEISYQEQKNINQQNQKHLHDSQQKQQYAVNELILKYENTQQIMNSQLEEQINKNIELMNFLQEKEDKLQEQQGIFKQEVSNYEKDLQSMTIKYTDLMNKNEREFKELQKQLNNYKDYEKEASLSYEQKIKDLEEKFHMKEMELEQMQEENKSKLAALKQENQFLDEQRLHIEEQFADTIKSYETQVKVLKLNQQQLVLSQKESKIVVEMKESHLQEVKKLQCEISKLKEENKTILVQQQEEKTKLEKQLSMSSNDHDRQVEQLNQEVLKIKEQKQIIINQMKHLEQKKLEEIEIAEKGQKDQIEKLEFEYEESKKKLKVQNEEQLKEAEKQIISMKQVFEVEISDLKAKIQLEKQKNESSLNLQLGEISQKHSDEINKCQNELDQAKVSQESLKDQLQQQKQQYEFEISLQNQNMDHLERTNKELKLSLQKLQQEHQEQIQKMHENNQLDKTILLGKLESYNFDSSTKEKCIYQYKLEIDDLKHTIQELQNQKVKYESQQIEEKNKYLQQLEQLKNQNQSLQDEFLEKQIQFEKQIALQHQNCEFLEHKLADITNQLDQSMKNYEEKIVKQKQYAQLLQSQQQEHQLEEKTLLQQRLEKNQQINKEQLQKLNIQIQALEKQKQSNLEQIDQLEKDISNISLDHQEKIQEIQQVVLAQKDQIEQLSMQLKNQNEQFAKQLHLINQQKDQVCNQYDRDKMLWQSKFDFLTSQRDQMKSELKEYSQKYDETLKNLQLINQQADSSTFSEMLIQIEQKYQQQLYEAEQKNKVIIQELETKIGFISSQMREIQDKHTIEVHQLKGKSDILGKKVQDQVEVEKLQQSEINQLKLENINQQQQIQKRI